jgi:hypothetical protein
LRCGDSVVPCRPLSFLPSLPAIPFAFLNGNPARGQFFQQLRCSGRNIAVSFHNHRPLQIFSKFPVANLPFLERHRFGIANLNQRKMPRYSERTGLVGRRTAKYEVIVAIYQNADHPSSPSSSANAMSPPPAVLWMCFKTRALSFRLCESTSKHGTCVLSGVAA